MKTVSITVMGAPGGGAAASTALASTTSASAAPVPALSVAAVPDPAVAARQARFGHLPERVRYEDLVVEQPIAPGDGVRDAYNAESSWCSYNCLAMDLGL